MRWLHVLALRLRAMFRRAAVERELEAEMADHLASETEALIARGLTPDLARRTALATMGRDDAIEEECRDARGVNWWEDLRHDTVFALRLLARNKTWSATAVITMALGSVRHRPCSAAATPSCYDRYPFPEPERLISAEDVGMRGPFDVMRSVSKTADYAAHLGVRAHNLQRRDGEIPERIRGSQVSANFFDVLAVRPMLGRTFQDGEDRPGQMRVAVLSHAFWAGRFGARADAVGQQIVLDEVPHVVAGVMPEGFRFPSPEVQVWTPMVLDPRSVGDYWGTGGVAMFARLRPGATRAAANAELKAQVPRIRAMFPWRMPDAWGTDARVRDLRDAIVSGARLRSWMLLGAVVMVLLISVVNVANLMIGSTAARAREIAVRTSLGATPGRLGRQLLTEALVLGAAGGVAGVALAYAQMKTLKWLLPTDTPRLTEVALDGRVMAFAAVASLLSGILVGLWPAWLARSRRTLVVGDDGTRGSTAGPGRLHADGLLVLTEAALVTVLLVGSGLLLRSVWSMLQVDPGFQVESVVTAELSPGRSAASSAAKRAALWEDVRARLLRYPGVREVASANVLPLTPQISAFAAAIEDHPIPAEQPQHVLWSTSVTPEYAATLGVKLLEGRLFTRGDHDRSEPVALVSKSTARRFWPGGSAVGRRLKPVYSRNWTTIVGVVDDVRIYGISGPPAWVHGEVYLPMAQSVWDATPASLVVRTDGDPDALRKALPGMVSEVCGSCAVSKVAGMRDVVRRAVETPRSTAWLVGGFATLALVMAAAAIYGVVNHAVVRRTRELGVRLALGAGRRSVAALVILSSLRSVVAGCALGLGASWFLVQWIRSLLFGVGPHDAVSFGVAPVLLVLTTLAASAVPAARAIRIDPAECLREG